MKMYCGRIRNGELTGQNPKLIVLMTGTNNIQQATSDEIAVGGQTIRQEFGQRLSNTCILLLGLLLRADRNDVSDAIVLINSKVINLGNGYGIYFFNMISSYEVSLIQIKSKLYRDFRPLINCGIR
jgi:hypothetical protein